MLFKPHTVAVLPAQQDRNEATKAVFVPTFSPSGCVACQITPEKPNVALEALGVMITNPHTLLCEVIDAPNFTINARLQWKTPSGRGRLFRVAGPLQTFEMGTAADCGMVLLEELTMQEDDD